jgi:hypothetical protein
MVDLISLSLRPTNFVVNDLMLGSHRSQRPTHRTARDLARLRKRGPSRSCVGLARSARRVLQPVGDVLPVLDPAFLQPPTWATPALPSFLM